MPKCVYCGSINGYYTEDAGTVSCLSCQTYPERRKKERIMSYTDTELLDFLQSLTDRKEFTGKVLLRNSDFGRGWRLHETEIPGAVSDVRQAISDYMDSVKEESNEQS